MASTKFYLILLRRDIKLENNVNPRQLTARNVDQHAQLQPGEGQILADFAERALRHSGWPIKLPIFSRLASNQLYFCHIVRPLLLVATTDA